MSAPLSVLQTAVVTKLKTLRLAGAERNLFDVVEGYSGQLEKKGEQELEDEVQRRGMLSAFVLVTPIGFNRDRAKFNEATRLDPEVIVLIAASNLSDDTSAVLTGSANAPGLNDCMEAVSAALEPSVAPGVHRLIGYHIQPVLLTKKVAIVAMIFHDRDKKPTTPNAAVGG